MDRPFYPEFILGVFPRLLARLPVTLLLMTGTVIAGSLLGFLLAKARLGRSPLAGRIAGTFIVALRCTPSIVLLFIIYYALPELVMGFFGIDINGMSKSVFVILTLSLLFSANMGELMRAAYLSVDKGQREAALSAGLSEVQAFFRVTAPQALTTALPNFCNALVALMKEGALAYTIGMIDMMGEGSLIISRNYGAYGLETYIALALIYWAVTIILERGFRALEKRLSRGRRSIGRERESRRNITREAP
ncbi:MAG: amino acid ABC transporter permease [Treponema sp.]|nr:amino acid ABC transporter permease [Treponema sp.]